MFYVAPTLFRIDYTQAVIPGLQQEEKTHDAGPECLKKRPADEDHPSERGMKCTRVWRSTIDKSRAVSESG